MGGMTLQTESEYEEQMETALEESLGLTAREQASQIMRQNREQREQSLLVFRKAWESEQAARVETAAAAINGVYREAEQHREQHLAALTGIGSAREGVKLGDLLASPALDSVRDAMKASVLDATGHIRQQMADVVKSSVIDIAEHVRRQMTAPLGELPRLMLGDEAFENLRRASCMGIGESAIEIMRGAGIADGIMGMGAWEDAAKSLSLMSTWQDQIAAPALGIADSFRMLDTWQDSLPSFADAQREREQESLSSFARAYAAERAEALNRHARLFTDSRKTAAAAQQQRQETMLAAFADVDRWQRRWEVYEPEPPAEQIEVVHLPSGDWQEVITTMHHEGKLSPAELIDFALQLSDKAPGRKLPSWTEIEAIALAYKERGHKFKNQALFAQSLYISREALQTYLRVYEAKTGEKIRPGRGRSKLKRLKHN